MLWRRTEAGSTDLKLAKGLGYLVFQMMWQACQHQL